MQTLDELNGYEHMFKTQSLYNSWKKLPVWLKSLCIFTAGGISALGQAPFDIPALTLFGLAFGIWAIQELGTFKPFLGGWVLGFGYFSGSLYWIIEPFLVDAAATGWMAPFALMSLSGGLAILWGLAFKAVRGCHGLMLCLSLTAAEFVRAYLLTGFPWVLIGYVWIDTPVYQLAAWIGPHGMTFLTLLCAWGLGRRGSDPVAFRLVAISIVFFIPFLPSIKGPPGASDAPIIRLINPNVAQKDKWHLDKMAGVFDYQIMLTKADPQVDLVVWPEASVYMSLDKARHEISEAAGDASALVGVQRISEELRFYNSAVVIDAKGNISGTYDKNRLVPFGEFIPLSYWTAKWGLQDFSGLTGFGFSAGSGAKTIEIAGLGQVQPLICYEAIFPQYVGRTLERPSLLILISNDAWFGSFQGPAQHFAQARARTIELGLPLVRVANRGVTAIIDARGGIDAVLWPTERGSIDAQIPIAIPPTFYAKYRDLPLSLLFLIAFSTIALGWVRRKFLTIS